MSGYSVKKPYTIFMAVIMVIILGVVSFTSMTTDLFPKMELPYVVVVTTYPGATPEKVELAVTKPLEQTLATTSGVKNITSVSQENMSMVILEFENGINMDSAMIEMNGSLDLIKGSLDDMVSSPILMKMNPDMLPLMVASVDMDGMNTTELSTFAQEHVIPELERLGGVASVSATGLLEQRYDITLNQQKIDRLNDLLTASVDTNLSEAQQKLREARTQLESGKNELKAKQAEGQQQLVDGSVQISSATATLNALLSEETTLTAQKQAFQAERNAYAQAQAGYQAANDALAGAKAAALAGVDQAKAQIVDAVNAQLAAVGGATAGLPASVSTYEEAAALAGVLGITLPPLPDTSSIPGSVDEALAMTPEAFNAFKAMGGAQLAELSQETLAQLKNAVQTAATRLPEIDTELRNMELRLTTIAAMKPQLQSALSQANNGYAKLEEGKLALFSTVAAAETQLALSEQKLNEAQSEFDTQRDAALEQANLGGILTTDMLKNLLAAQNFSMPAGTVTEGANSYTVKVGDTIGSLEELKSLPLLSMDADGLRNIRLQDVADITLLDNAEENYAKINGNDGLILSFNKQSTSSTAEVSKSIRAAAQRMQTEYPGLHITPLMDQGVYIDIVIGSVLQNLLLGAVLAILILLLFLRDWKPTLIIGVSIPISVMFAVVLMYFSGVTLNIVSLSGLALGIGMLVDNSIVVIENTYRLRANGMTAVKAAVKGASQVAGAICASTLTTICVFLPIVFTEGITRQIFTDMGLTIAYSLIASLVVALTLVPAMARGMLQKTAEKNHVFFDKLVRIYEKGLSWSLRHKAIVLLTALALFIVSIASISLMGTSFVPESDGTQISITAEMPDGTLAEDARAATDALVERIESVPDVKTVGAMMGGASLMGSGGNSSSLYVLLKDDKTHSTKEIAAAIRKATEDLPCTLSISTSNMDMSMLGGSGLEIVIKGRELDTLRTISSDITALLQDTQGIGTIDNGQGDALPELYIEVDKAKAVSYGLTVAQVYQQVAGALAADTPATTLSFEEGDIPAMLVNRERASLTRESIRRLELTPGAAAAAGTDKPLYLSDIALVSEQPSFSSIRHENQTRTLSVTAELAEGYNIGLVSRDFEKQLQNYTPPAGYTVEIAGENATINESLYQLCLMLLLGVAFIYMIMAAQFQSLKSPFIVMFTIPLAFTGGLLALFFTVHEVSVLSMLGFLLLAGVVVNNGIVFVDYTNQLRLDGMEKHEALLQTGRDRIRPVLMTALTTILGLSTMALGIGTGADMMQPMAIVVIGGLSYATLLTLFVVPCLYAVMNRKPMKKIILEEAQGNGTHR